MLRTWISLVLMLVMNMCQLEAVPPVQKTVTNENIRDAILSLVHTLRTVEDKLERHEFRERAFAEHVKKSFAALDKRTKFLESVKGTVGRLDERLAGVETILMEKDAKSGQLIKDVMEEMAKKKLPETINGLSEKLEDISKIAKKLDSGVDKLNSDTDSIKKSHENLAKNAESAQKQLSSSEMLLQQYEHKLTQFNDKIHTEIVPIDYKDQNGATKKALEEQQTKLNTVLDVVNGIGNKVNLIPTKDDLLKAQNMTLDSLEELHDLAVSQTDKVNMMLDTKFSEFAVNLDKRHDDFVKSVSDLSEMTETLTENLNSGHEHLKKEIASLPRVEEVIMQTADGLLDTKRRVEFGVHQILLEVGDLVKQSGERMNQTIQERFDSFEFSILDSENGALANLTSKIGTDIDQVWRQIGMMHKQMSVSADTLNKLQSQTDSYVDGSLTVMDSMKNKVGQITSRMNEVDENLNNLMGRLSLVSQEFNRIKGGLGKALDEIRASFVEVQDKIKDKGPGPHNIPKTSSEEQSGQI